MKTYCFRLYFQGLDYMSEDTAEALYEAGCDDCTPGSDSGRAYADFSRDAESLEAAVASAATDSQRAGCDIDRVEIDGRDILLLTST